MAVNYRGKKFFNIGTCGLDQKYMTIVNDDSSVVSQWRSKLIDDVIYDRNMFII